ncbi:GGDEF domain-containing protein [Qipengyuania sphaerica]|uniref:GGDEF domain-containing protein n=1 Tax=Qipengyuania sphaerica TaxID=2867243 RepID=UPI001C87E82D|nr:GGDEF domain-containing protein [Qipengyuania sphaerica]MBX7539441.1 GGDEF domain-containing protein [Qipengyuania sphaerica]
MERAQKPERGKEATLLDWWMGKPVPCPAHLRAELQAAVDDRQYREGRFVLIVGFLVAVFSLVVDALTIPEHLGQVALLRLGATLPVQLAAFLTPRERMRQFKFFLGLSLCVFSLSLIYASSLAPPPANAFMALGVVALLGIAVPLLPFGRLGIVLFLAGVVIPCALLTLELHEDFEFSQTFLAILVLVALGGGVLARRVRWLERWTALLTLEAEDRAAELEQSNRRLTELSMQDPLTNLANRRWAELAFKRDYALTAEEGPGHTALLLMDLDHFKDFNDRWGHDAGDKCLQAVAEVLRHSAGAHGGLAARFGGEEFVVVLRANEPNEAIEVAEELRLGVERIEMAHGGSPAAISCTTSIGIALHEGEGKPQLSDLLKRADKALYEAKRDGRNRHRLAA